MTTKTINEQAREIAQKLVDLEISRKEKADELKEIKEEFMALLEEHPEADTYYDFNQGVVSLAQTTSFKIPDGLQQAVEPHSLKPDQLDPEIIKTFMDSSLKLNKQGIKAMKEGDVDLSNLIVVEEKTKVVVKVS